VKLLLNDNRIDLNKAKNSGETPFYSACKNNSVEVIKILLSDGRVDINKAANDGTTPFYSACGNGYIEIVKLLLNDQRISIRKKTQGKTGFDIAKTNNHSEIMKLIKEFDTGFFY